MKKLLFIPLIILGFTTGGIGDDHNGEELFKEKCTACHLIYKPEGPTNLKAPPRYL